MKVDKDKLRKKIQAIIADGIIELEEVDITTDKVMDAIHEIILAAQYPKLPEGWYIDDTNGCFDVKRYQ